MHRIRAIHACFVHTHTQRSIRPSVLQSRKGGGSGGILPRLDPELLLRGVRIWDLQDWVDCWWIEGLCAVPWTVSCVKYAYDVSNVYTIPPSLPTYVLVRFCPI